MGVTVLPYWIYENPPGSRDGEAFELIKRQLESSDEDLVIEASLAVFQWSALSKDSAISQPPKEIFDILFERIVFRKKAALQYVIYQVASILKHTDVVFDRTTVLALLKGIKYIWELVQISEHHEPESEFMDEEKPGYLVRCTMTIAAFKSRYKNADLDARTESLLEELWLKCLAVDFPEIRKTILIWNGDNL